MAHERYAQWDETIPKSGPTLPILLRFEYELAAVAPDEDLRALEPQSLGQTNGLATARPKHLRTHRVGHACIYDTYIDFVERPTAAVASTISTRERRQQ